MQKLWRSLEYQRRLNTDMQLTFVRLLLIGMQLGAWSVDGENSRVYIEANDGSSDRISITVEADCGFGRKKISGRTVPVEVSLGKACLLMVSTPSGPIKKVQILPLVPSEHIQIALGAPVDIIDSSNDDHEYSNRVISIGCELEKMKGLRVFAISDDADWVREGQVQGPGRFRFTRLRMGRIKLVLEYASDHRVAVYLYVNTDVHELRLPCSV